MIKRFITGGGDLVSCTRACALNEKISTCLRKLVNVVVFDYISKHACDAVYIGLMSTPIAVSFYEKFGFAQRFHRGMGPGMIKFYTKDEVIE